MLCFNAIQFDQICWIKQQWQTREGNNKERIPHNEVKSVSISHQNSSHSFFFFFFCRWPLARWSESFSCVSTPQIPLGADLPPRDPETGSSWTSSHRGQTWFCSRLLNKHIHSWPAYPLRRNQTYSCVRYLKIRWHLVEDEDTCEGGCHLDYGCAGPGTS